MSAFEAALERQALRVYRRFASEVVERFNLCPWAHGSRREGGLEEIVLLQENPADLAPALNTILRLAKIESVAVALLIFPRLGLARLEFERFVAALRDADARRHDLGAIPFAMAAFHPEAEPDLAHPERLIPFLRRTPDPTIQLVRRGILEAARSHRPEGTEFVDLYKLTQARRRTSVLPPLGERIAQANHRMVQEQGVDALRAVLDDIVRDRSESYARVAMAFGVPYWGGNRTHSP